MVWQAGWAAWKAWSDVPEIAGQVPPTPAAPPVPNVSFHYHGPGGEGEKTVAEILALLKSDPDGKHMLWKSGFESWTAAAEVDEVKTAMQSQPPPPPPLP